VQFFPRKPERRRWNRRSFNVPVRLITDSAVVDGRGIRLSEGGMYLFSASNLELGARVEVDFSGTAGPQARSGIVRYRALYLYGVEFLGGA
jgi:PilZ domain